MSVRSRGRALLSLFFFFFFPLFPLTSPSPSHPTTPAARINPKLMARKGRTGPRYRINTRARARSDQTNAYDGPGAAAPTTDNNKNTTWKKSRKKKWKKWEKIRKKKKMYNFTHDKGFDVCARVQDEHNAHAYFFLCVCVYDKKNDNIKISPYRIRNNNSREFMCTGRVQ